MMSAASDMDVFQVWADMVCYDESRQEAKGCPSICIYSAHRKSRKYRHTHEEIMSKYANEMVKYAELSPKIAGIMGDYAYMAKFATKEEAYAFADYVIEK